VIRPVDVLLEFLAAEQARGITHVHLDEEARLMLREVHNRSKITSATPRPAKEFPPQAETIHLAEPQPAAPPAATLTLGDASRIEQLDSLRRQAENWQPAKVLGSLRETMVFSTGNPEARLMLVGEAPGYHEEKEREPFVGPAGQKLNDILKAMNLPRERIYISNIVKFRPATANQTTNNRKPSPEEIAACLPFIRAEVGIVKPECIIALGGTAAEGLLGLAGSVSSLRSKWHAFEGVPVRVTYHPSYLLQSNAGNTTKRQLWEDMLAVMEKLELPITERQRGFFLPKA
jgi:uracil-DNA glycosylase family 4